MIGNFRSLVGALAVFALTVAILAAQLTRAAENAFPRPAANATGAQQLLIEQVEQLIAAGSPAEALEVLQELSDQSAGEIVSVGPQQQAGTLSLRRFIPLRDWVAHQTAQILASGGGLQAAFEQQQNALAATELNRLSRTLDATTVRRSAQRLATSAEGRILYLLLADIYLEQGWALAATDALTRAAPLLRVDISPAIEVSQLQARQRHLGATVAWFQLWAQVQSAGGTDAMRAKLLQLLAQTWGAQDSDRREQDFRVQVLKRLLRAAAMDHKSLPFSDVVAWVEKAAGIQSAEARVAIEREIATVLQFSQPALDAPQSSAASPVVWRSSNSPARDSRPDLSSGPGQGSGIELSIDTTWPKWSRRFDLFTCSYDRTDASLPRAGEHATGGLIIHPLVYRDRIYVCELDRILAFDGQTGAPWPTARVPLFSRSKEKQDRLQKKYPLIGVPRKTLTIHEDSLYARMGNPITGWLNHSPAPDGGSKSCIVGLDLRRQGSMLRGFPIRLNSPEFENAEFEGSPAVQGDLLFVCVTQRDNVGIRRSVVAFDRFSGHQVWRSPSLASGAADSGDASNAIQASLISHVQVTAAGGKLYCSTNLGTIVCLDAQTGAIDWLSQYSQASSKDAGPTQPNRFRYRDVTPCIVAAGLVYCAPSDCAEVFALDAFTGDLVWSTDDVQAADTIHMLGVTKNHLILSGDRLVWLDRVTGQLQGRFPGATTPGRLNALPKPRGLGRGAITGSEILFPVEEEILVLPAELPMLQGDDLLGRTPDVKRRLPLATRGHDGGNLVLFGSMLIYASSSRIMAFE